jgi:hypothetical protein
MSERKEILRMTEDKETLRMLVGGRACNGMWRGGSWAFFFKGVFILRGFLLLHAGFISFFSLPWFNVGRAAVP